MGILYPLLTTTADSSPPHPYQINTTLSGFPQLAIGQQPPRVASPFQSWRPFVYNHVVITLESAVPQADLPGKRGPMNPDQTIEPAPIKPLITMDDLEKVDIRLGTILQVDDLPRSDKLVKLTVDFGDRQRAILVGMKGERDDPAEIVGRQALFVVNLPPRKMAGETSEGMLFDIGYADGLVPALALPERPLPNGARAG
jgi:tRNA-binding protein